MLPLFLGRKVGTDGRLSVLMRTAAIPASVLRFGGWAMDEDGQPYVDVGPVASDRVFNQGIAFTPDGAMYVTDDAVTSTSIRTGGVAVSASGAVHYTVEQEPLSGGIGLSSDGSISLGNEIASFSVDLQSSAIPEYSHGSGTPTFTRATTKYVLGYAAAADVTTDDPLLIQCASGEIGFTGARRISEGVWSSYDANGVFLSTTNGASALCCDASGPFGYLAEGARTNSALHSRKLAAGVTATAWVESNITAADDATGVDGVANACSTLTATANAGTILQAITLTSAAAIFQPFVKRKTGTGTIEITLNGGTNWTDITAAVDAAAPDWYRLAAVTATLANPSIGYRLGTSGDEIEVDMNDCQNGTFRSSPIPTTTAAVTRNRDVETYASAGNASAPCTVIVQVRDLPSAFDNSRIIELATNDSNRAGLYIDSSGRATLFVLTGGVQQAAVVGTTNLRNASGANLAVVIADNDFRLYVDGVAEGTPDTSGTAPAFTTIHMGAYVGGAGFEPYCNIRFLRIYPQALSAAQIEAMTA